MNTHESHGAENVRHMNNAARSSDEFFDGLWLGIVIGMAAVFLLFGIMAAAGVYGG